MTSSPDLATVSEAPPNPRVPVQAQTLVCVPSMSGDALQTLRGNLREAFADQPVLVLTPDETEADDVDSPLQVQTYSPAAPPQHSWVPRAADYVNAWTVARDRGARAVLVLGPEAGSVSAHSLGNLAAAIHSGRDLAVPRYPTGPRDALVNNSLLYPVTRALYSSQAHFAQPVDVGLSMRMSERLATAGQRLTAASQNDALLWPLAEAAVGGMSMQEVPTDARVLPHPNIDNLNTLLNVVAGSLFSDIEAKAAFWQRARLTPHTSPSATGGRAASAEAGELMHAEIAPMIENFRLAYTNLRELWSLVLPPNSLLSLKKLSLMPVDSFRMPDALWARTVYDFILAFRLRTINRGHLLGALTPLYLAWVASHLRIVGGDAGQAHVHVEEVAAAFENDKPYFVSRWRWPDRFNP